MQAGQERTVEQKRQVADLFKKIGSLLEQGRRPHFMNVSIGKVYWSGVRLRRAVLCEIPPEGVTLDTRVQSPKGFDLGDVEYKSPNGQAIQADQIELSPQQAGRLKRKIASLSAQSS